jgi:hypothetical protein
MSAVKKILGVSKRKGPAAQHSKGTKDSMTYQDKPSKAASPAKKIGKGGKYIP